MKTKYLKILSILFLATCLSAESFGRSRSKKKYVTLYSTSGGDKSVGMQGSVGVPQYVILTRGVFKSRRASAVISYDESIECTYNNRKSFGFFVKFFFDSCSDGSGPGDRININTGLRFSVKSASKVSMKAIVRVHRSIKKGIKLPEMNAQVGQFLQFDGELWSPSDGLPQGENSGDILVWDGSSWTPSELPATQGAQGPQGEVGATGPQGLKGDKGEVGATGPKGIKGDPGLKGDIGPAGAQGLPGAAGVKGDTGATGPQGLTGAIGAQGAQGIAGPQGLPGAIGPQGPQGPQGASGPQGIPGAIGPQGPQGLPGALGAQGPQGLPGSDATVSLTAGTGIIGNNNGVIGATGEIAVDVGTAPGQIPQLDSEGRLAASVLPQVDSGPTIKVAHIKDIKPSGTHGGDCISGDWRQRTLNTLDSSENFVALQNNQIILQPGSYLIHIQAPAYLDNIHKAILRNISTGSVALAGTSGRSHVNYGGMNSSFIEGRLEVAAATVFEIQHRCTADRTVVGFGIAANFGVDEVYTQVKVTKID